MKQTEALGRASQIATQAAELEQKGEWNAALPLRQQSVRLLEDEVGVDQIEADAARVALSTTFLALARHAEARALLNRCLASRVRMSGEKSVLVANALVLIGKSYRLDGSPEISITYYQKAESMLDTLEGGESLRARTMTERGLALMALGETLMAEELFQRTLRFLSRGSGIDPAMIALPLSNLGEIHRSLGQLRIALGEQEKAVRLLSNKPQADPLRLSVEAYLASTLRDLRQFDPALAIYTNCIARLSRTRRADDPDLLSIRRNYAKTFTAIGDHHRAESIFTDCLSALRASGRTNESIFCSLLTDLGDSQQSLGNVLEARRTFEAALSLSIPRFGEDHPLTCGLRERSALLAMREGDFDRTYGLLKLALDSWQRNALKDERRQVDLASCYLELAKYSRTIARLDKAEFFLEQALTNQVRHLTRFNPAVADTMEQLGLLAATQGNLELAVRFHTNAHAIRTTIFGEKDILSAQSEMNIAGLHSHLGKTNEAAVEAVSAYRNMVAKVGPDHPMAAMSAVSLGAILQRSGQLEEAVEPYQQALRSFQESRSRHVSVTARDLGFLELSRGRTTAAMQLALEAVRTQEELWRNVFRFGSEQDRLSYTGYQNLLSLTTALANQDPLPLAQSVLHLKNAVLDSLIEDRQLAAARDGPESKTVQSLMEARGRSYQLQIAIEGRHSPNPDELRLAQERVEILESELARKFTAVGTSRRAFSVNANEICANLPDSTVLVEYVRYGRWSGGIKVEPYFGALVFRKTRAEEMKPDVQWIELGPADGSDGIGTMALALRDQMQLTTDTPKWPVLSVSLSKLAEKVWEKVEAKIPKGTSWVMIVPDGELNFVPFAGLWRENRFLGEDYYFRFLGGARDLLGGRGQSSSLGTIDIWANPEYARTGWKRVLDQIATSVSSWELPKLFSDARDFEVYGALPSTATDAEVISKLARRYGLVPTVFTGPDASERSVRTRRSAGVMHFATHGSFRDVESAWQGYEQIPNSYLPRFPRNPMARSWLTLARCNETLTAWLNGRTQDGADDGLLTADEVASMDLQATWLVTLSACNTGLGVARNGEGVFGLRRAFALAGVQHLAMTLWPVYDLPSLAFMTAFYADALKTRDAPGALARTQRAKLLEWSKSDTDRTDAFWHAAAYTLSSRGF